MFEIIQSHSFKKWLSSLKDRMVRTRIFIQINKIELGNLGDVKPVGGGVSEIRMHFGSGYRIYFKQLDSKIILLLVGGTKFTQVKDIAKAKEIAINWKVDE
jgi:putative addiction module killer protein